MPRTISAGSIAKLAQNVGTEPIAIIEIQWRDGGPRTSYSDRDIAEGVKGAIIELSGLDDVIQVSGGAQSQQISITLDDTDGELKTILDSVDVHKRAVWVYQWFAGLPLSDKFLIFKGVINSPIEWNEGDRTLKFEVISNIEDVEVGFSIEEGDFTNPPADLIGKAWPLVFGTCLNIPALRTTSPRRGILAEGTGIHDFTLEKRIAASGLPCPEVFVGYEAHREGDWGTIIIEPVYEQDQECQRGNCQRAASLELQLAEQLSFEINPVRIFGGEKFPQNQTITLNINGGKFIGKFAGDIFTISARVHPEDDGTGHVRLTNPQAIVQATCGSTPVVTGEGLSPEEKYRQAQNFYNSLQSSSFFWANAGATVTLDGDEEILYIANLLPSTILRVAAYRTINGARQLLTVPDSYYTIRETNYTGYTGVTELAFTRPLSTQELLNGGGWEDNIYVTLTSSEGPNTVDILEWFITTYTQYSIDATSFNAVRTQIDNYPMHFPLLERKNIITVLEEIAYQARCALWLKDDVFYIKYLAAEPTADGTVNEDDVLPNSLRITHTSTEDLITEFHAEWRADYAIDKPNKVVLRHNVKKYGTHKQNIDFYCFNILDLVRKAATFWLIRKANTWRRAIFKTPISKLKLESLDTVALTLTDVGPGTIKGIVEKANFDGASNTIDFEVWTPCKAGTNTVYDFAWPAEVGETLLFPTIDERNAGFAGSGHEPNFSTIAPVTHVLANKHEGLFQGFQLACNGQPVVDLTTGACRSVGSPGTELEFAL